MSSKNIDYSNIQLSEILMLEDGELMKAFIQIATPYPHEHEHFFAAAILTEIQRREGLKNSAESKRTSRIAIWISSVSLFIALIGFAFTICSFVNDNHWGNKQNELHQKQINVLMEIKTILTKNKVP